MAIAARLKEVVEAPVHRLADAVGHESGRPVPRPGKSSPGAPTSRVAPGPGPWN